MAQIKYTSKIRRGLAAVAELALASLDDNKPTGKTITSGWTAAKRTEFNAALDYIEQENKPKEPAPCADPDAPVNQSSADHVPDDIGPVA